MTLGFVFPGQGSQQAGMGQALAETYPAARAVFEEVDDALGEPLSRLMFEGPEDKLVLTENAQPALMAVSVATARTLEAEGGFALRDKCAFVAGHSLGEYSALTAVGSLDLADTARLLRRRGQSMQQAVPVGEGAMAAMLGLDLEAAEALAAEAAGDGVCSTANDNAPGQVVLSGSKAAVDRAIAIAPDHGARRCIELPVSAPFHCALMAPAAAAMAEALATTEIRAPSVPLVSNVTARAVTAPDEIRSLLVAQVTGMVRWRESMLYMRDNGVDTLVELGAGKVLTGLVRRIDRDLNALATASPDDVAALLATL
jgi:[acyl-carrier-protein] S-malonyltransferase